MCWVLNKYVVFLALAAFVCYVVPVRSAPGSVLVTGKSSADEAASWRQQDAGDRQPVRSLRYALPMASSLAQPDSTEFEFPEKEEKHLARDITVFVIVSAFVAYFIIKVFLEGDKDEENTDDGGGKDIPPL